SLSVDGDGDWLEPASRHDLPDSGVSRVLDSYPLAPGPYEDSADQADRLREAGADEGVLGLADHAPDAAQVGDERFAQARRPSGVAVRELDIPGAAKRRTVRLQPLAAGEG